MKKLLLPFVLFILCSSIFALPVGNPSESNMLCRGLFCRGKPPSCPTLHIWDDFSYRMGYYGDFVFNRLIRNHDSDNSNNSEHIKNCRILTNAAYLDLNVWKGFDIFGTLGATNFSYSGNQFAFGPITIPSSGCIRAETANAFSWSVGVRGILYEWCGMQLGMEGQFFQSELKLKKLKFNHDSTLLVRNGLHTYGQCTEMQVGIGISRRFKAFLPYIAAKWSEFEVVWRNNPSPITFPNSDLSLSIHDLRGRKHWGMAVGCSLISCNLAALTLEGRFIDENALYVNAQFRF